MTINEACKKAMREGLGIKRNKWGEQSMTLIPTNTDSCIIIVPFKSETMAMIRWNPKLEDLIANDWYLVH